MSDWADPFDAVAARLGTPNLGRGLTRPVAEGRLEQDGPNVLAQVRSPSWVRVLARQFTGALVLILLVAAGVSAVVGEVGDALTILAIVALNGSLGFVQEWRAERAMQGLQRMLSPRARVLRDGALAEIDAAELVVGDVVALELGDRVPADLRLIEARSLEVDESALTGESTPSAKQADPVPEDTPLAERRDQAYLGTAVTQGRGRGLVVATGMRTEFGRIADLTLSVGSQTTPLQRKLAVLGRQLGILSIGVAAGVSLIGVAAGRPALEMFLTGVALAVAVVPEGLPAVVTITLALGVGAMLARRALLRRLQAAEALGAATVICSDKTGTLTRNEMTVREVWLAAGALRVTGSGYDPTGHFEHAGAPIDPGTRPDLVRTLRAGSRCNNATLTPIGDRWQPIGSPTEVALVVAAHKAGLPSDGDEALLAEVPFSSTRKRMTRVHAAPGGPVASVKGAPEVVLQRCTRVLVGTEERPLDEAMRLALQRAQQDLAACGLRTLALADRRLPPDVGEAPGDLERELVLLGVVGILDPPREEVPAAIATARGAGIQTIMITGDAAGTALAIGERIGLGATAAVTGAELEAMDDAELEERLGQGAVFARMTPEHKLRIVEVLQRRGEIVAMTGDGVNDAPALKRADIGVAMGQRGTEVARAAADMILLDDNYASIVGAVAEGRRQYANIRKFVGYLLSSNTGEVVAIAANLALGGPLLLLPVQILWMNLVTDGVTAVALGLEAEEPDAMERPPLPATARVLDRSTALWIAALGAYLGVAALWLFHRDLHPAGGSGPRPHAGVHRLGGPREGQRVQLPRAAPTDVAGRAPEQSVAGAGGPRHPGPAAGRGVRPSTAGHAPHRAPVGPGLGHHRVAGAAVDRRARGGEGVARTVAVARVAMAQVAARGVNGSVGVARRLGSREVGGGRRAVGGSARAGVGVTTGDRGAVSAGPPSSAASATATPRPLRRPRTNRLQRPPQPSPFTSLVGLEIDVARLGDEVAELLLHPIHLVADRPHHPIAEAHEQVLEILGVRAGRRRRRAGLRPRGGDAPRRGRRRRSRP